MSLAHNGAQRPRDKALAGRCNPFGRAPKRSLLPLVVGERIRIIDKASVKNGWQFGIVVAPRNPLGPETVAFKVEGDKPPKGDEGVCILPRDRVERA